MRLSNCQAGMHYACHGWQTQYADRAENNRILICGCTCEHAVTVRLVEHGTLRPPPGLTPEQFVAVLRDDRGAGGSRTPVPR